MEYYNPNKLTMEDFERFRKILEEEDKNLQREASFQYYLEKKAARAEKLSRIMNTYKDVVFLLAAIAWICICCSIIAKHSN